MEKIIAAIDGLKFSESPRDYAVHIALQYNIATNFDVNLVWQSFFSDNGSQFEAINHQCFLRFKWSF